MANQMKFKFDKYWSNVSNINILMFITLILDPRNKMKYT
ncbi:Zinc finger BED domain-containing protein RICESLEEPER 2 [Bienertia sinuspersici]